MPNTRSAEFDISKLSTIVSSREGIAIIHVPTSVFRRSGCGKKASHDDSIQEFKLRACRDVPPYLLSLYADYLKGYTAPPKLDGYNDIVDMTLLAGLAHESFLHHHYLSQLRDLFIEKNYLPTRSMVIHIWNLSREDDPIRILVLYTLYLHFIASGTSIMLFWQGMDESFFDWEYFRGRWIFDYCAHLLKRSRFQHCFHDEAYKTHWYTVHQGSFEHKDKSSFESWISDLIRARSANIFKDCDFFSFLSQGLPQKELEHAAYLEAIDRRYIMKHSLPFLVPVLDVAEGQSREEAKALAEGMMEQILAVATPEGAPDSSARDGLPGSPPYVPDQPKAGKRKRSSLKGEEDYNKVEGGLQEPENGSSGKGRKRSRKSAAKTAANGAGGLPGPSQADKVRMQCRDGDILFRSWKLSTECNQRAGMRGKLDVRPASKANLKALAACLYDATTGDDHFRRHGLTDQFEIIVTAEALQLPLADHLLELLREIYKTSPMPPAEAISAYYIGQARDAPKLRGFVSSFMHYSWQKYGCRGQYRELLAGALAPEQRSQAWIWARDKLQSDLEKADRLYGGKEEEHPAFGLNWKFLLPEAETETGEEQELEEGVGSSTGAGDKNKAA